jgi:hypothetical protein
LIGTYRTHQPEIGADYADIDFLVSAAVVVTAETVFVDIEVYFVVVVDVNPDTYLELADKSVSEQSDSACSEFA